MNLEQELLTEDGHLSKKAKTEEYFLDPAQDQDEATDAAVDFALHLLAQNQQSGRQRGDPTIAFSVAPHRDTIGLRSNQFVGQICASISASELSSDEAITRAPIDIVVALDVSGSMRVEKLDLCKNTLKLLLRELHHDDRFCLISFSDEAKVEVPMLKVNDNQKRVAMHTIDHLHVKGRTNIASAISLAAQIANGVPHPNKVRSVFLLTDGQANVGPTDAKDLVDLTKLFVDSGHNPRTPPISLHTFGYGPEPDHKLLLDMAKSTAGGSFYPVRDKSQVASAFGDAIGGILSVVAHNVSLMISVPVEASRCGTEIIAVHHENKTEVAEGVYQVYLGDLYAEETRDIIFEVSLACPSQSLSLQDTHPALAHALVELTYDDTIHHTRVGPLSSVALIKRPNSTELSWPNRYVAMQWLRVRTAICIAQAESLDRLGELDKAKTELTEWIEEFTRESFEIGADKEPLIEQLRLDLTESLDLLKGNAYNAYVENDLGVRVHTHMSQRCSQPFTGKRNVYRTGQKRLRAQAFNEGSALSR